MIGGIISRALIKPIDQVALNDREMRNLFIQGVWRWRHDSHESPTEEDIWFREYLKNKRNKKKQ